MKLGTSASHGAAITPPPHRREGHGHGTAQDRLRRLGGGGGHGAGLPGAVGWYTTPMEMRPATREEFDDFDRAVMAAFHREVTEEDRRAFRRTDEPERSLAWFDDGRIVAGTSIYSRHVTVPGAVVPCAAVTAVGVVPTHRRRGLLTAMMRRQLEDVRARGEPVAALWASEGAIYGRFGYGIAARDGAPDRPPPRGAAGRAAPGGRPAARGAGGRPRRAHARGATSASAASARACSTGPGRGGTPACTTPSRGARARSRCRRSSSPTAMRSTRCAPTATRRAPRARWRSASSSPRRRRRARCCGTSCSTRT